MARFPRSNRPSRERDEPVLDMILDRVPPPPETPPQMAALPPLLADLSGPAEPGELAMQAAVLSRFRSRVRSAGTAPPARRKPLRRLAPMAPGWPPGWWWQRSGWAAPRQRTRARCPGRCRTSPIAWSTRRRPATAPVSFPVTSPASLRRCRVLATRRHGRPPPARQATVVRHETGPIPVPRPAPPRSGVQASPAL